MIRRLARLAAALLCALLPAAQAHKPSDSLLRLQVDGATFSGRWEIALRDLDAVLQLDADRDGALTAAEVQNRQPEIAALALAGLALRADDRPCVVAAGRQSIGRHSDGAYAAIPLHIACPGRPTRLAVAYTLFADIDAQHRGLLRLEERGVLQTAVLGPPAPLQIFHLRGRGAGPSRWDDARQGAWQAVGDLALLAFLATLVLPAVRSRPAAADAPAPTWRGALLRVVPIALVFTLAHAAAYTLGALGAIEPPAGRLPQIVAAAAALAVLVNLLPALPGLKATTAGVYGLARGLGAATAIAEPSGPVQAWLGPVAAAHAGLVAWQLVVIAVLLPAAWAWRDGPLHRRPRLAAALLGGAALAAISLPWLRAG